MLENGTVNMAVTLWKELEPRGISGPDGSDVTLFRDRSARVKAADSR
jgi:hypothetical protein